MITYRKSKLKHGYYDIHIEPDETFCYLEIISDKAGVYWMMVDFEKDICFLWSPAFTNEEMRRFCSYNDVQLKSVMEGIATIKPVVRPYDLELPSRTQYYSDMN